MLLETILLLCPSKFDVCKNDLFHKCSIRLFVLGRLTNQFCYGECFVYVLEEGVGVYTRTLFSQILAAVDFSSRQISGKTLSIRKNYIKNINSGQRSSLNLTNLAYATTLLITNQYRLHSLILCIVYNSEHTHFKLIINFGLECFYAGG